MRFAFQVVSLAVLSLLSPALRPAASPRPRPSTSVPFAAAVAIAGNQILVGRPGSAARADAPRGGVYVFHRGQAGQWTEAAVLAPRDLTATDAFGTALAVDGALLAVGAPGADQGRGAIYLFARDRTGRWQERAKLRAPTGAAGDSLGAAVVLRGGLLLVGAPGHARGHGMAAVFRQGADAATWAEPVILSPSDTTLHCFGHALALAAGRLFVSAPDVEESWLVRGQVVVFRDSARSWVEEARLSVAGPPTTSTSDLSGRGFSLGMALAVTPDGATLWASSAKPKPATVYTFHRDGAGRWTEVARLRPAAAAGSPLPNRLFGQALAADGRDLIVSSPEDNALAGTVYVFRFDSTRATWTEVQRFTSPDSATGASVAFGRQLAVDPGLLVVGDPRPDAQGVAVIYRRAAASRPWQPAGTVADTDWTPWTGRPLVGAALPCTQGKVHWLFDCQHIDLLAYLPAAALGSKAAVKINDRLTVRLTDLWGWTDSATHRTFALVARVDGTAFVEVTDPVHPRYLGELPLPQGVKPSPARDVKVYQHHAFIVADGGGPHGMQIFDLTQLLAVKAKGAPVTFKETAHYSRFTSAHNLAINPASGYAYAVGSNGDGETCDGGLHMIDIRDPLKPTFAGCYADRAMGSAGTGYIHDAECVRYGGPDSLYRGRELCFTAAETVLGIVDVSDKQHPKTISVTDAGSDYIHQGWLSADQRYFYLGHEGEQSGTTSVLDVSQLDRPAEKSTFPAANTGMSVDHNLYVRGRYLYQSDYHAGLRVFDVQNPQQPTEVGSFDTTPSDVEKGVTETQPGVWGVWSAYPYFKGEQDGVVAVSSVNEGLFLLRVQPGAAAQETPKP